MKKTTSIPIILIFISLFVLVSCGSDDGGGGTQDPKTIKANELSGTWNVTVNGIKRMDGPPDGDWSNFNLTVTGTKDGGSYTANGVPDGFSAVWPAKGDWDFMDDSIDKIVRSDNVVMTLTVSATALTLTFDVPDPNGRVSGIEGGWKFPFEKDS